MCVLSKINIINYNSLPSSTPPQVEEHSLRVIITFRYVCHTSIVDRLMVIGTMTKVLKAKKNKKHFCY